MLTKGGRVRELVPVQRDARTVLEEWLAARRDEGGALFPTRTGAPLTRAQAFRILQRAAVQANAHRPLCQ